MVVVGESRTELLNWLNELLQLDLTKVEQCGTGAVYCQIMDSIYQDVPISKVKFDLHASEYNFLANFKVLQSCFVRHGISKPIPVEKLIKCKFQDNLEFLQWIRKFWVDNKDESPYHAVARRNGAKGVPRVDNGPTATAHVRSGSGIGVRRTTATSSQVRATSGARSRTPSSSSSYANGNGTLSARRTSATGIASTQQQQQQQLKLVNDELAITKENLAHVTGDLEEYKVTAEGLESERDFYFDKLRQIEILTQSVQELISNNTESDITVNGLLSQIQEILYTTEEGFQVPNEDGEVDTGDASAAGIATGNGHIYQDSMVLDEETF